MTPNRRFLYPFGRLAIMGCRAVHEMIWTILLVSILGFGMLAGALALTLFCIGFAGKLMSEEIEAIDKGQVEAIRATGANELQVFAYAVLPQVRVAWTGIAIYTWDVAFRAATVVGFFWGGRHGLVFAAIRSAAGEPARGGGPHLHSTPSDSLRGRLGLGPGACCSGEIEPIATTQSLTALVRLADE